MLTALVKDEKTDQCNGLYISITEAELKSLSISGKGEILMKDLNGEPFVVYIHVGDDRAGMRALRVLAEQNDTEIIPAGPQATKRMRDLGDT